MKNKKRKIEVRQIFALTNRGMLLDIFVFLMNLYLMQLLASNFIDLVQKASDGDPLAAFAMFLFCLGIFILPPLGATLKRWHFHQRLRVQGRISARPEDFTAGCLFNPIFYFCLNLVIFAFINAFIFQSIYGNKPPGGTVFVSSVLFGMVLVILQTVLIYRYFLPPKTAPTGKFLRDPRSEIIGDVCIYLNMILFQMVWNLITTVQFERVSDLTDLAGRFFFLSFVALLIYFPPRMFYLAEDIKKRRVWLTVLLANSPVIWRVIFGAN